MEVIAELGIVYSRLQKNLSTNTLKGAGDTKITKKAGCRFVFCVDCHA